MVRGYPDYSPGVGRTPEGLLLPTIAEPPVWFEDNFESALSSWGLSDGYFDVITQPKTALHPQRVFSGSGSLKITSFVGGRGSVTKYLAGLQTSGRVGIAVNFMLESDPDDYETGDNKHYLPYLTNDSGELKYYVAVTYDPTNGKIYIYDSTPGYIHVATNKVSRYYWSYVKVVIDLDTKKYVRLYFNDESYDISSYSLRVDGTIPGSKLYTLIQTTAAAAKTVYLYIDDYKLTYGET